VDLASSGSDADRSDIEEVGRGSERPSSPADAAPDDVTTAVGPAASSDTSAADVPASAETGRGAAEPYPAPRAPAIPLAATPALRLTRAEMEQWDDPRFGDGTLVVDVKTAEGSLSTIWRATWTADDEPATVAVKELRLDASVRTEALRSFAQEVRICSRLRHANICAFLGTTLRNGSPALVLEYLGGGTLHHALHNPRRAPHTSAPRPHPPRPPPRRIHRFILDRIERTLTGGDIARIALEVASGMAYLHRSEVIHRDVKSANVMLNEAKTAKVSDFGIATCFAAEHTAETGTYRFMAPEVRATRRTSPRTIRPRVTSTSSTCPSTWRR